MNWNKWSNVKIFWTTFKRIIIKIQSILINWYFYVAFCLWQVWVLLVIIFKSKGESMIFTYTVIQIPISSQITSYFSIWKKNTSTQTPICHVMIKTYFILSWLLLRTFASQKIQEYRYWLISYGIRGWIPATTNSMVIKIVWQ